MGIDGNDVLREVSGFMKILSTLVLAGLLFTFAPRVLAGNGQVQYRDLRDKEQVVIDLAPIAASKDRTAIIAYGGSDEVLRAVYTAAQKIEKTTDEDIFFLQAPDRDGDPSVTEFRIYTHGVHTSTMISSGDNLQKGQVLAEVTAAIQKGLERVKAAEQ